MVWQSLEGWIPGLDFQWDRRWSVKESGKDPPDRRNGSMQAVGDLDGPVQPGTQEQSLGKLGSGGQAFQSCHKVSECKRCAHTWPKTQQQEEGGPRAGQTWDRPQCALRLHGRLSPSVSAD